MYNKSINDYILIEGSVPGHKKRLVRFRGTLRNNKKIYPIEIKYISLESKQGV